MQLRKFLFVTLAGLAIIIAIAIFIKSTIPPKINDQSPEKIIVATPAPTIPQTQVIEISGIPVNNFYKNAAEVNLNTDALITETSSYQIAYLAKFGEFLITVLGSPFPQARATAEQAFISKLGITKEQACQLTVFVSTPSYANPDYSGQKYNLSFCTSQ